MSANGSLKLSRSIGVWKIIWLIVFICTFANISWRHLIHWNVSSASMIIRKTTTASVRWSICKYYIHPDISSSITSRFVTIRQRSISLALLPKPFNDEPTMYRPHTEKVTNIISNSYQTNLEIQDRCMSRADRADVVFDSAMTRSDVDVWNIYKPYDSTKKHYTYRVDQNYYSTLRLKLWSGNGTIRPGKDQSGGRRLSKAAGHSDRGKKRAIWVTGLGFSTSTCRIS